MNRIRLTYLILIAFVFQSCLKKTVVDELMDPATPVVFTISGTLYGDDGSTPLANSPLELLAYAKGKSMISTDGLGVLGSQNTGSDGRYSFTYSKISNKDGNRFLQISKGANSLPAAPPYLKEIPINTSFERDICTNPVSKLIIKFELPVLKEKDTFFFYNEFMIFSTTTSLETINGNQLKMITKENPCYELTLIGEGTDANHFLPDNSGYYIAKGWKEFDLLYKNEVQKESPNYVYPLEILRFPETTHWTVKYHE